MPECRPPVATLSAGATTSASSAGPINGTRICLGLLAVSAARRRARVASALVVRARRGALRVTGMDSAMADMRVSLLGFLGSARSRGLAQGAARQLEVDVV